MDSHPETTTESSIKPSFVSLLQKSLKQKYQYYLDCSVPYIKCRWAFLAGMVMTYCLRVYLLQGFYIVTYGLGIFLLNLFIGFLTPLDDQDAGDGPMLPTSNDDDFRPFVRRLPEFKFWYSCAKAVAIAFCMTFVSIFNVPVFWPILLIYFIVLFVLTMKRQIKHMIKHRYLPFDLGKKKYARGTKQEDIRSK